ncbi:tetratricopeptide repeat protein, partial [Salmonella sp. SAL4445]|uniref:tetratricopeptide repeat protein n=1 Tax=Salmonella sp. SAL4445 TaxID=3159900 RepID=UPI00397D930C
RDLYARAVQVATDTADNEMLAGALFSRGYLMGVQGQYAAGLTDLKRAQAVFEEIDLPDHALTALNAIAILYNRMGDYAQAI